MKTTRVGLDLGGTKLLGIVADRNGRIQHSEKINVPEIHDNKDLVDIMGDMIGRLHKDHYPERIGISVPGPVGRDGSVATLVNLGLRDLQLRVPLEEKFGLPVRVGNDVNCATLAEHRFGAGQGFSSLFTFYPGTGLGGGYIQDNKLVTGLNGTAGEVGHIVVDINGIKCNCGNRGCLETIVSNIGFRRMLSERGISDLKELYPAENISYGELTKKAWAEGQGDVCEVIKFQARILGIGIANIINLTGVECILIGGNLYRRIGKDLLPIVQQSAEEHSLGDGMKDVAVRLTSLGAEAPALGTTLL